MNTEALDQRRPLAVALVGCGRWGSSIADAVYGLPDFALRWICDPEVRRPGIAWAPDLSNEVCRDVDAVIVATPPKYHLGPTLRALDTGKPVLVEKPFLQSIAEVRQVRALVGNTPVMVGHLLAYHPGYRALIERVQRASDAVQVEVVRRSPARGANRCPWWTLAPHDLALLTRLFGEPNDLRVLAGNDGVQAQLSWRCARASLSYSTVAVTKRRQWLVNEGANRFLFDEIEGTLQCRGGSHETVTFKDANPLNDELRHFAACARREVVAHTGIDEAEQSVRLLCWGERQLRRARGGRGQRRLAPDASERP